MSTTIQDSNGDTIWSTEKLGSSDVNKTKDISNILKDLLTNLTINTKETIDITDETKDGFYTKNQIDTKLLDYVTFSQIGNIFNPDTEQGVATAAIEKVVNEYFQQLISDPEGLKDSIGLTDLETAFENFKNTDFNGLIDDLDFLSKYTLDCYFRDIMADNRPVLSQALSKELNDLLLRVNSTDSNVNNILDFLGDTDIGLNTEASTVRGAINELDSEITGLSNNISKIGEDSLNTTAKNLSGAINELNKETSDNYNSIININAKIGEDSLNTTAKNLSGAINELLSTSNNQSSSLISFNNKMGTSSLQTEAKNVSDAINEVNNGLSLIESNIGSSALVTDAKTILEAINELKTEVNSLSSRVTELESKLP